MDEHPLPSEAPESVTILSQSRSLYSTGRFFEEAFRLGKKVKVYPPLDLSLMIDHGGNEIFFRGEPVKIPHCIIPRVGQLKPSYTLAVIRQFEMMGAIVLNSSQAISRARDKLRSLQVLSRRNIPVVKTVFLDSMHDVETAMNKIGSFPMIIKVPEGTQGVGVILAESRRSARSTLDSLLNLGKHMMLQEFVREAEGRDVRAIVLGNRLIASMQRSSSGDEFRSNVHRGGAARAIKLGGDDANLVIRAARMLGLQFAGVDMILSARGPLIMEVNPSPGLEGIEKATGVNIARECIQYMDQLYLESRQKKFSGDSVGF